MFTAVFIPEFPVVAWHCFAAAQGPRVIVNGVAPQERVYSLCSKAATQGVEHGMSRAQAEAGSSAVFRGRSMAEEDSAFAKLLEIVERFTPRTECIATPANAYSDGSRPAVLLLLDSAGIGTLFGTAEQYGWLLHRTLHEERFPAHIGVAANAEAASLFARCSRGIVCASASETRGRLAQLPISLLPCEERLLSTLRRWGIRTLGELAALPRAALISRLGQQGERLQQLARGEAEHLLVPEAEEFTLCEKTELDQPVELLDSLLFVLSPMLERILRKAMDRAYAIRSVTLMLTLERAAPHTIAIRPATPTQNRDLLLRLLNLELQAHPPSDGIVAMTITAEPTEPQTAQRGLFQAQFPEPDRLELLLARLRSIAGQDNVGSPVLVNSHDDSAFRIGPYSPSAHDSKLQNEVPSRLALRVFRPPQDVRVTCWGEQPRAMFWQGARLSLAACAGPWHSSGSWWDGQTYDHDLWDVVTTEPVQALRLRQEHATKTWAVMGRYD